MIPPINPQPAAPSGAKMVPSPVPSPAVPSDTVSRGALEATSGVEIYRPAGPDQFRQTTRIPVDDPDRVLAFTGADGLGRQAFTSGDGGVFRVLREDGTPELTFTAPEGERIGEFLRDDRQGRFHLRTGHGLVALDAGTGVQVARRDFDSVGFQRRMALDGQGHLLLADGPRIHLLDGDLKELDTWEPGFESGSLRPLGNLTLAEDGQFRGRLSVLRPGKPAVQIGEDVSLDSLRQGPDGRLWFVKGRSHGPSTLRVGSFDPASGRTTEFRSAGDLDSVLPTKDGRLVLVDDRLGQPGILVTGPEGGEVRAWSMGQHVFLRQFLLSTDERTAFAVTDEYPDLGPTIRRLHRMDLSKPEGLLGGFQGFLADHLGQRAPAPEIYRTENEKMLPMPLADGRVVVFREKGVDVLAADGTLQATWRDSRELLDHETNLEPAAARVQPSATADGDLAARLRDFLEAAASGLGQPSPPDRLPGEAEGWSSSWTDGTLHRTREVPTEEALRRMGLGSLDDYKRLLDGNTLFNTVLQDRVVAFPGSSGAQVEVGTHEIHARVPVAGHGLEDRSISLPAPRHFTTALPLMAGGSPHLVAATSDGMLSWYDLEGGATKIQRFDLGAPVQALMAGPDRVYALTDDGAVMVLRVALGPDQSLEAPPEFRLGGPGPEAGPAIREEEGSIVIGTVRIERRR